MESTTPLSAVLDVVPEVEHAFGYGSGVFAQPQASASDIGHADAVRRASGDAASAPTRGTPNAMVDYVFAVRSPLEWHADNMRRNPSHYAPHLRALGPAAVVAIADRVGVGVHFNTLVPWRGGADAGATLGPGHATHYKYGVVSLDTLCDDLTEWRSLFVAGRMQKPVAALAKDDDARSAARPAARAVAAAETANLRAALAAALLTLPETFSAEALRAALCGLSYRGDARGWLGAEDRHKVARIAAGSAAAMDALYAPVAAEARAASVGLTRVEGNGTRGCAWGQDKSQASARFLCRWLPRSALGALGERTGPGPGPGPGPDDADAAAARAATRRDLSPTLLRHVEVTVRRSSLRQIAASALATSPAKAAAYAAAKFAKSAASRFRKPPR